LGLHQVGHGDCSFSSLAPSNTESPCFADVPFENGVVFHCSTSPVFADMLELMRCVLPCYTFFWGLDYVDAMSLELSFHQRKTWQLNVHCKDVLICKSWRFCTFWSFAMWDAKAINGWTMVLNHKHDSSSKLQPTHWIHRPPLCLCSARQLVLPCGGSMVDANGQVVREPSRNLIPVRKMGI